MPLILKENPYRGVNAHLNSALQNEFSGWLPFHAAHIDDLFRELDRQLPPRYEAVLEQSLQIREFHPETGERIRYPVPDVSIYETEPSAAQSEGPRGVAATPTLTLAALETLEDRESYVTAVVIRDIRSGSLVTRIELLSPTNKPPGDGFLHYVAKRDATLKAGTVLVEIDYLHESRPVIRRLPSYPDRQPGSTPYSIILTDPRPTLAQGVTQVYGFGVDDPIPVIDIPLAGDEALTFDFGVPYQRTFEVRYFYSRADYAQEPVNFDRYSEADQARIRARMQAVAAAHAPAEG